MISCILLSAGYSSRFGSPKALANIGTQTALAHIAGCLVEADVHEVVIVLGAGADKIEPHVLKHNKISVVYNKNFDLGQTSSVKAGLRAVSLRSSGVMLLPVDYPFIRVDTFSSLIAEFRKTNPDILIPTYGPRKGHPPIFSASLKEHLLLLDDSQGINQFIRQRKAMFFPVGDEGVVATFNTQQEFEHLVKRFL